MSVSSECRHTVAEAAKRLGVTETFYGVDPGIVEQLVRHGKWRRLEAGEVLFRPGQEYIGEVFILYVGTMEVRRPDNELILIRPGEFLGLANYLDSAAYQANAVALDPTEMLVLEAVVLHDLERKHPSLFNLLNHIIAERLRQVSPAREPAAGLLARPVYQIMKTPLSTCDAAVNLRQAFTLMQERKIGSLVVKDNAGHLIGVLTFAGLAEAVLLKLASPEESVMRAACEMPRLIDAEAPVWRAEERLQQEHLKYLIVEEGGAPVGIVSQTDILRLHGVQPPALIRSIVKAQQLETLMELFRRLPQFAAEARDMNRRPSQATRQLSDAHLAIQRRCLELVIEQMQREGYGAAPVSYAVVIMGSGGRREMMLGPDQDNGMVLSDEAERGGPEIERWFMRFGELFNEYLDRVGYPLCRGDIMVRNPMFRKTLTGWCDQITHMMRYPNEKAARWSNIVFDFDTLAGDDRLTTALRRHVHAQLREKPKLLEFMVQDDAEGRPPLGLFNRLISAGDVEHKGRIDIKRNGLRIVADAARIYALRSGVAACNTSERLLALMRLGVLSTELVDSVRAGYEELLDLLLEHQIEQCHAGIKPDKLIDPSRLTPRRRSALRVAMRAVKRLQHQLQDEFSLSGL